MRATRQHLPRRTSESCRSFCGGSGANSAPPADLTFGASAPKPIECKPAAAAAALASGIKDKKPADQADYLFVPAHLYWRRPHPI
jgi:hypothetical protein